jgi:hypothetical protein
VRAPADRSEPYQPEDIDDAEADEQEAETEQRHNDRGIIVPGGGLGLMLGLIR